MTSNHTVLYDPEGLVEVDLPLDRTPHELLVKAVLAWTAPGEALELRDCHLIALELTGHARAVADDVRRCAAKLPVHDGRRALAEVVLRETERGLATPLEATVRCAQSRARVVRDLYERLDRLERREPARIQGPAPA
ncbi:restriction endonuclease [Streptomyces sp. NPDC087297]|uniref:restriction endonuclease n=1 Tax=Streptomyces sp. NPDC087297 TaxID=3365778 RepID=UPI0037FBAAC2